MNERLFEQEPFGKVALQKMGDVPDNFRLYEAGFIENNPKNFNTMKIVGAEFRAAKSGPNKGRLTIMVPYTKRVAYVTKTDIQAYVAEEESKGIRG